MKQIRLSIALLLFANLISFAQTVTNLRFEQSGKMIDVYYDLSGKSDEFFQIKLYCNLDGGKTWGSPLKYVTGEVGENIRPGTIKKITWDVLKEKEKLVGEISFKIEAENIIVCRSFTITHKAASIAPVTKTVTYGTVETDLTGSKKCWITQNLGSDRQATSATDASEASAGWYWQFNRKQGYKHDGRTRTPHTKWDSSLSELRDWQIANDPCILLLGSDWRLPTRTELVTADANNGWDNYNETYSSVLKLHGAGCLNGSVGSLSYCGSFGYYWSSSQSSLDSGWCMYFFSGGSLIYNLSKSYGFTTRCLRD